MKCVFNEDFEGSVVNSANWTNGTYPWGDTYNHSTGEQQVYNAANVVIANGCASFIAKYTGSGYTSGFLQSYLGFNFLYGYLETYCQVPKGQGLWSSLWTLGYNYNYAYTAEIDLFEVVNNATTNPAFNLHFGFNGGPNTAVYGGGLTPPGVVDLSQGFHKYAFDWGPGFLDFYLDDIRVGGSTDPRRVPQVPQYLLMGLPIGGQSSFVGVPSSNAEYPIGVDNAQLVCDYIRVYQ
jgi:beta-glucanase (GH16 family)